ncbi:Predicted Fe-Mo cluster-binding protein, NifX family [Sporobacter termitidis DSM 10068]|uniref:Predicted Fe-Mo cluster-binding protein, NifX family n=1 Tax=Sporobacter termitidis DSM 10068 TaxID=1123282 RepID=A0A1M5ZGS8_9FIRM|nr:NifB/NifX family molybdenum-iron cluster-binding protein [Sporobacter termitidis]SHI23384.1 Predicted Fe-Mo cluster-binding protein, NifX family [Sporobacter termitidis DSM 10068]
MLIAVSADGQRLSSAVSQNFESCRFLLFVETDTMSYEAIEHGGDAAALADKIVGRDCEAVITGAFTPEIFNTIANACVTRYSGAGLTVAEALDRMDKNTLEYIRFADKDDACHGDHGGGECNCGEEE